MGPRQGLVLSWNAVSDISSLYPYPQIQYDSIPRACGIVVVSVNRLTSTRTTILERVSFPFTGRAGFQEGQTALAHFQDTEFPHFERKNPCGKSTPLK